MKSLWKKQNTKKQNHSGFTLVELIVALAISVIVTGSVAGFMATGSRSFTSTNTDVNLQTEAQQTINQLQDLMIDATNGVSYKVDGATVLSDHAAPGTADKEFIIYNQGSAYIITWEATSEDNGAKLLYSKVNYDSAGNQTVETDKVLMSEFISDFKVDLTSIQEKNVVRFDLTLAANGREYSTFHNVTLRNMVKVNDDTAFEKPEETVLPAANIEITASGATGEYEGVTGYLLHEGENLALTSVVKTAIQTNTVNQAVEWSIKSYAGADVASNVEHVTGNPNAAYLQFANGEDNATFSITASQGSLTSNTIVVIYQRITSVTITKKDDIPFYPGSSVQMGAKVEGIAIGTDDQSVTWKLMNKAGTSELPGNTGVSINASSGKITVSENPEVGTEFRVQATANKYNKPSVIGDAVYTVEAVPVEDLQIVDYDQDIAKSSKTWRNYEHKIGAIIAGKAVNDGNLINNVSDYSWNVKIEGIAESDQPSITVNNSHYSNIVAVKINDELDYSKSYNVIVTASKNGRVVGTGSFPISKVGMKLALNPDKEENYNDNLMSYQVEDEEKNIYYKVTGLEGRSDLYCYLDYSGDDENPCESEYSSYGTNYFELEYESRTQSVINFNCYVAERRYRPQEFGVLKPLDASKYYVQLMVGDANVYDYNENKRIYSSKQESLFFPDKDNISGFDTNWVYYDQKIQYCRVNSNQIKINYGKDKQGKDIIVIYSWRSEQFKQTGNNKKKTAWFEVR